MIEPTSWHSYPKVWNVGHGAAKELFLDEVIIEEKVDGSQFSFGAFQGVMKLRSKGQEIHLDSVPKMFEEAASFCLSIKDRLTEGYTYRAEYLQKPKHNVLAYDRIPNNHLIIFDINTGEEQYLSYEAKKAEADRLGLEIVPLLFKGKIDTLPELTKLLDNVSILGGQKIEGFVIKNYARFGPDKKALLAKHVCESFKEVHKGEWKKENPGKAEIIDALVTSYRTPARWQKSVQHLKDAGSIQDWPQDIGKIIKETQADLKLECEQEIKDKLFAWAWPQLCRRAVGGLPEWYKAKLLEKQIENTTQNNTCTEPKGV